MQAEHPLDHLDAGEGTDRRRAKGSRTEVGFHDQQSVLSVPRGEFPRTETVDDAQVRLVREGSQTTQPRTERTAMKQCLNPRRRQRRHLSPLSSANTTSAGLPRSRPRCLAYAARGTTALRRLAASSDDTLTAEDRGQSIESLDPQARIGGLVATPGIGRPAGEAEFCERLQVTSSKNAAPRETHDRAVDVVRIAGTSELPITRRELRTFPTHLMAADEPEPCFLRSSKRCCGNVRDSLGYVARARQGDLREQTGMQRWPCYQTSVLCQCLVAICS